MNTRPSSICRVGLDHALGLHARPCLAIVERLAPFDAQVRLRAGALVADASSVLELLSLGAPQGTELELEATGPDAHAALEALVRLIQSDFLAQPAS